METVKNKSLVQQELAAIRKVTRELEKLPKSSQERVLDFVLRSVNGESPQQP